MMWQWIKQTTNQKTLAWLGTAMVAIAGAGWAAYEKITTKVDLPSTPAATAHAASKPAETAKSQQISVGDIGSGAKVEIKQSQ